MLNFLFFREELQASCTRSTALRDELNKVISDISAAKVRGLTKAVVYQNKNFSFDFAKMIDWSLG